MKSSWKATGLLIAGLILFWILWSLLIVKLVPHNIAIAILVIVFAGILIVNRYITIMFVTSEFAKHKGNMGWGSLIVFGGLVIMSIAYKNGLLTQGEGFVVGIVFVLIGYGVYRSGIRKK